MCWSNICDVQINIRKKNIMQFNNVYIQHDLFGSLKELLERHVMTDNLLLVSDANTAFAYVLYNLPVLVKKHVCLFALPKVTLKAAKDLGNIAKDYDAIIAVGSGSISDLAKYAAYHAGIPYVMLASAPSMNGYLSGNASLYDHGIKQSFSAMPPRALFADLGVLQNAPKEMIAAGVGDVLCRSSVQFDMLLSHHLTGSKYPSEIFAQMLELEGKLLAKIDASEDFVQELMDCLLYGGVAMKEFGSSAPASQSEHMLVHMLEMLDEETAQQFYHGQLVGAASVMMLQMQNQLLQQNILPAQLKPFAQCGLSPYFDSELLQKWNDEYQAKIATFNNVDWKEMKNILQNCPRLSVEQMAYYLRKVGCEVDLSNMGFEQQQQSIALYNAAFTRGRFTILDLINAG